MGVILNNPRRRIASCLLVSALVLSFIDKNGGDFKNRLLRSSSKRPVINRHQQSLSKRPVIHTFFDSLTKNADAVLKVWEREWTDCGFETKVLTIEDAERHPDFEKVVTIMEPLHGKMGYDSLCFYRWLAMAASGGGWMSDHDTMPTNFPLNEGITLPNNGTFTSFQLHVPALISGTAEEWDRVTHLLLDAIPRIPGSYVSDMHAFNVLLKDGRHGIIFMEPRFNVQHGFQYRSFREVDCEKMSVGRAIHFSHSEVSQSVQSGLYPLEYDGKDPHGTNRRAEAIQTFLDDWRNQCNDTAVREE